MRLIDAISVWYESKEEELQANLFIFNNDSQAQNNGRKIYGFFFDRRRAHWLGDIFETHIELRKRDGAMLDYIDTLDPSNPDFFNQLERHLREPR